MLKALGLLLKLALFSIAVLLSGEWIRWDGRTLSQHVVSQVARAQRSDAASYLRGLSRRVTADARSGFSKKTKRQPASPSAAQPRAESDSVAELTDRTETQAASPHRQVAADERIPPSERQKLRALIRELNSSRE